MKTLIAITLVMALACPAFAVPYIHNGIYADGALAAAPNPSLTVAILNNNSQTVNVKSNIWYDLVNASATGCIIRLMNTTTITNWVSETIPSGNTHSYMINQNTNYINYSGCNGGYLHLM